MNTKEELTLAVLSTSGGHPWTPVQVQKIFFLLDEKIAEKLAGPHFDFQPYDYGPFDPGVYRAIEAMQQDGFTQTGSSGQMRCYRLTKLGQDVGAQKLNALPQDARDYIQRLSAWVRSLTFAQLVKAVYDEYPGMKVNSVFEG